MQNHIKKLKSCPDCGNSTDGKSCRCGWQKPGLKKTNRNIPQCKFCNMPGDYGGMCKMHLEKQAEHMHKKRMMKYAEANKKSENEVYETKHEEKENRDEKYINTRSSICIRGEAQENEKENEKEESWRDQQLREYTDIPL